MAQGRQLELNVTSVFERNLEAYRDPAVRFVCNEGGSRSSKTTSIVQLLVVLCMERRLTASVVRKTFPALKASVMRDFVDILVGVGLYDADAHNRTDQTYTFPNGSVVDFFSCDEETKLRGRKRELLVCNEANELGPDEFNALALRTSGKVWLDWNPHDVSSWVYELAARPNARLIRSTYLDNPFLGKEQVDYIASLVNYDENYHRVFALGERPTQTTRVYTHFVTHAEVPPGVTRTTYGLDLGFQDPTVLVRADFVGEDVYLQELYWETGRTTSDVVRDLKGLGVVGPVYSDHRPEVIEELKRAGLDVHPARKDILLGIDSLKRRRVSVHQDSLRLLDEVRRYSYRTLRTGELSDGIPLDRFNHGCDAARYAVYQTAPVAPEHRFFVFDG